MNEKVMKQMVVIELGSLDIEQFDDFWQRNGCMQYIVLNGDKQIVVHKMHEKEMKQLVNDCTKYFAV